MRDYRLRWLPYYICRDNDLLALVNFLNNITLKSNLEKEEFFRCVYATVYTYWIHEVYNSSYILIVPCNNYLFIVCNYFYCRHLAKRLHRYRSVTIVRRLLKMLLSRFALAEPSAAIHFFPHLFTPCESQL